MNIPASPPGVSLDNNMRIAFQQGQNFSHGGDAFLFSWFYKQVKNRGPWDFKQKGAQYESFGNFHYGAVGTAAGFSKETLLRAAGAAQSLAGTSNDSFGKWWSTAPFGDDPRDQYWIEQGIDYAKAKCY
jgi:hypothetical protein